MIKKLAVIMSVIGIIICSFATMSMAYGTIHYVDYGNRYNGSYYYDIAWASVTATGQGTTTYVDVSLLKDGVWQATKRSSVSGTDYGNTVTCYSYSIQGSGANGAHAELPFE